MIARDAVLSSSYCVCHSYCTEDLIFMDLVSLSVQQLGAKGLWLTFPLLLVPWMF